MPDPSPPERGGYVTDVPYPRSFVAQITPPTLRLVAALNGHPPPPDDTFAYCDLGCASGDTLTTLAAANPKAHFVGVDIGPGHIAKGRDRAGRGRLENVRFVQADFEQLVSSDLEGGPLPRFDLIVAHGIWSWVSSRKREAILAFVDTYLKPGGLFYLGYNALPGWSDVEPLRRILLEHTPNGAPVLERARLGVELLQRLIDSGAAYFATHPVAKSMVALMQKGGPAYVVHEYFHAEWAPMHVGDVARSLAAHGLGLLGQVPLYANVRELALPPSLKKAAASVTDRVALEGLKDFATNELFRSDVYVKARRAGVARSTDESRFYFEGTAFGTLATLPHVNREVRLPHYTLAYKGPLYDAILAAIASRARTAMELALLPEVVAAGGDQLRVGDCLQNLVLGGQVVPVRLATEPPPPTGRLLLASAYQALVLEEALAEEGPRVFASPVTGGGVQVSLLEALCIRLVTDPSLEPSGYADAVRAYAATRPMPLTVGDRKVKDGDELAKVMGREVDRFRESGLPKLLELGVLSA